MLTDLTDTDSATQSVAAPNNSQSGRQDRSVGELFSDLTRDLSTLVRQEVQLAKTEMTQKATSLGKSLGMIVAALLFVSLALQTLCAAAILGLATIMAAWLAALIVTGVLIVLAGVLVMIAVNSIKKEGVAPKETIETIQEDVQWAKKQMN